MHLVCVPCLVLFAPELDRATNPGFAVGDDSAPSANTIRIERPRTLHAAEVLFINFEGANVTYADDDDARDNQTQWSDFTGNYLPYGGGAKQTAVLDAVRAHYDAYDVTVTGERPDSGNYDMVVVGPFGYGGGWATVDCSNGNPNSMGFVDRSAEDSWTAAATGALVAHEAGHMLGLDHIDDADQVMNQTVYAYSVFADDCTSVDGSDFCSYEHEQYCNAGQQNSHLELLAYLGESIPDTVSPVVQITAPSDGQEFSEGADFDIDVQASDADSGIDQLRLFVDGVYEDRDVDSPYGWGISGIPAGSYEFYVLAIDRDGNEAMSNVVTVSVSDGAAPSGDSSTGGPSADGTSSDPSADGTSAEPGESDSGGAPPVPPDSGSADDERQAGCACRSDSSGSPSLVPTLLLPLCRRRRSRGQMGRCAGTSGNTTSSSNRCRSTCWSASPTRVSARGSIATSPWARCSSTAAR